MPSPRIRGAVQTANQGATTGAGATTCVVPKDASVQVGDLIVIWVTCGTAALTWTCPGFTAFTASTGTNGSAQFLYRFADGTEGTTFTVTCATSHIFGLISLAMIGVNPTNPFDPVSYSNSGVVNASATAMPSNTLTTTAYSDGFLWFGAIEAGAGASPTTVAVPTGFFPACAEVRTADTTNTNMGMIVGYKQGSDPGAIAAQSGTAGGAHVNIAFLVAINFVNERIGNWGTAFGGIGASGAEYNGVGGNTRQVASDTNLNADVAHASKQGKIIYDSNVNIDTNVVFSLADGERGNPGTDYMGIGMLGFAYSGVGSAGPITQAVVLTDANQNVDVAVRSAISYLRTSTDNNVNTDAITSHIIVVRSASDGNLNTDVAVRGALYLPRAITDANVNTDVCVRAIVFVRVCTDNNVNTDTAKGNVTQVRSATDNNVNTDAAVKIDSLHAVCTDNNFNVDITRSYASRRATDNNFNNDAAIGVATHDIWRFNSITPILVFASVEPTLHFTSVEPVLAFEGA
jgi:hypothetical protein